MISSIQGFKRKKNKCYNSEYQTDNKIKIGYYLTYLRSICIHKLEYIIISAAQVLVMSFSLCHWWLLT